MAGAVREELQLALAVIEALTKPVAGDLSLTLLEGADAGDARWWWKKRLTDEVARERSEVGVDRIGVGSPTDGMVVEDVDRIRSAVEAERWE